MNNRGYYAVIPANVRYSNIPDGAKLLFGEITALCNEKGYCWATNSYFAELYHKDSRTIQRWISDLEGLGVITREVTYKANSKEVDERIIRLGDMTKMSLGDDKNVTTPHDKDVTTPHDKNVAENNTYINNTNISEDILANKNLNCPNESDNVDKVICYYRTILKDFRQPGRITKKKREKIRAILEVYTLEEVERCFKLAAKSKYLRGSPEGWSANLDWFIKDEDNIAKVLDGNYECNVAGFNNFNQRNYDMKELEEKMLSG